MKNIIYIAILSVMGAIEVAMGAAACGAWMEYEAARRQSYHKPGDALVVVEHPETADPLPIEDYTITLEDFRYE